MFYDRTVYELTFSNGQKIKADENHEWLLNRRGEKQKVYETKKIAEDYASKRKYGNKEGIEYIYKTSVTPAYDLDKKDLMISAYDLGVWLGDGRSQSTELTLGYKDAEEIIGYMDYETRIRKASYDRDSCTNVIVGTKTGRSNDFKDSLRAYNLLDNKHIPEIYLVGSRKQRLELLKGLMDTDGTVDKKGQFSFSCKKKEFADQFNRLLSSLGIKGNVKEKNALLKGKRFLNHRVNFFSSDLMPFKLNRQIQKANNGKYKGISRAKTISIINVVQVKNENTRCIEVDSDSHLFLCGELGIPTRNTELLGALQLYMLFLDKEIGKETYILASETKQAQILFKVCETMIKQNAFLKNKCTIYKSKKSIEVVNGAFTDAFTVLTANADTKDGLRASYFTVDEYHAFKSDDLYQVVAESQASRSEPLNVMISTAGYNLEGAFYSKLEYAKKVKEGIIDDDAIYLMAFEIPKGLSWHDKEAWISANPALGYGVNMEYLEDKYKKAQHSGSDEISFRCKHLNEWLSVSEIFIPFETWKACSMPITDVSDARMIILGFDLSLSDDFTAVSSLYLLDDNKYHLKTHFFIPEKNIKDREKELRVPLRSWQLHNHITVTPGDTIDLNAVYEYVLPILDGDIDCEIGYDPYRATALIAKIEAEAGFYDCIQVRQGAITLSAPTKYFLDIVKRGDITHCGNPAMNWHVSNLEVITDSNGNIKPNKQSRLKKIDGCAATINCLTLALRHFEETDGVSLAFI